MGQLEQFLTAQRGYQTKLGYWLESLELFFSNTLASQIT